MIASRVYSTLSQLIDCTISAPSTGQILAYNSGGKVVNSSALDGVTIGGVTPAAGTFTALGGTSLVLGGNVTLISGAANVLSQRNGTAAQTIEVFRTYTDASNYSKLSIDAGASTSGRVNLRILELGTGVGVLGGSVAIQASVGIGSGTSQSSTSGDLQVARDSSHGAIYFGSSGGAVMFWNGTALTWNRPLSATKLNLSALPTSSSGLSAGDLWNNSGVVNIV